MENFQIGLSMLFRIDCDAVFNLNDAHFNWRTSTKPTSIRSSLVHKFFCSILFSICRSFEHNRYCSLRLTDEPIETAHKSRKNKSKTRQSTRGLIKEFRPVWKFPIVSLFVDPFFALQSDRRHAHLRTQSISINCFDFCSFVFLDSLVFRRKIPFYLSIFGLVWVPFLVGLSESKFTIWEFTFDDKFQF